MCNRENAIPAKSSNVLELQLGRMNSTATAVSTLLVNICKRKEKFDFDISEDSPDVDSLLNRVPVTSAKRIRQENEG